MSRLPIVAIVGRPNVGKSTLFNRLVQRRHAIVDKQEGITRDRIYEKVEWSGKQFTLVDTGGYIPEESDVIDAAVREQVELAMNEALLILFVVDGRDGIVATDEVLAGLARESEKPVIVIVNKIDNNDMETLTADFFRFGMETVLSVSALEGRKIGDLLDEVVLRLGQIPDEQDDEDAIRVAIVGCPNVGKSSITNRLLGRDKSIVTNIPGTTRDAIDSNVRYHGQTFVLVDTAGLRKKSKIKEDVEFYSTVRTRRALEKSDVVAVVTDAHEGFRKQDQQIVERVIQAGKGLVMIINKWDLIEKQTYTLDETAEEIRHQLPALKDYPLQFVSAVTKQRISSLLGVCQKVFGVWSAGHSTSLINSVLKCAIDQNSPPAVKGKHIRLKYATQTGFKPPRITVFSNFPDLIPASYRNYLENQFRAGMGLHGTPLRLQFKRS
ncbi:MAG: ribosome biogenesis GTPase Der [Candidatus Neomarinimicrobiota bacterium]|nr:ribosome biogenesis GTPase Der [Candidatus Neomarinimicrobiota bacterium]